MYLINKIAKLAKVSVRTLHHYDRIGLLCPQKADNGYRYYSTEDIDRLQQILFYKYLGFSLKTIKDMLQAPETDHLNHLERQLTLLEQEQKRLSTLIETIKTSIQAEKGHLQMTTSEKFTGFSYKDHLTHDNQAVANYGQDLINQAKQRHQGKEELLVAGLNTIFQALADNLTAGKSPTDSSNQNLADKLLQHIRTYAFDSSLEVFGHIGQSYVNNPDFQKNIDQFAPGLAQYSNQVIQAYLN